MKEDIVKYSIIYNHYRQEWVVFREDYAHLSVRPIFKASTRKECSEWLKEYRRKNISKGE